MKVYRTAVFRREALGDAWQQLCRSLRVEPARDAYGWCT